MQSQTPTLTIPGTQTLKNPEQATKLKIDNEFFQAPLISTEPWLADPIYFSGVNSTEKDGRRLTSYRLVFLDFMSIQREIHVSRTDCYMNFQKVIEQLVEAGYCFDVTNPEAIRQLQRRLTLLRIDPRAFEAKAQTPSPQP